MVSKLLILIASLGPIDYDLGATPMVAAAESQKAPVVRIYTADWCSACQAMKADLEGKFPQIEIRWEKDVPDWVEGLPTAHWQERDGDWSKIQGRLTASQFQTEVISTLAGTPAAAQNAYEIRTSDWREWSFGPERTIELHLTGGNHKFTASELERYSRADLIRIHNYEHENGRPRASHKQVVRRKAQFCPT